MRRNAHHSLTQLMHALLMLLTVSAGSVALAAKVPNASEPTPDMKVRLQEAYGKLPLSFEANQGQSDAQVKFLSRGPGYTLFLTPTEAVLALKQAKAEAKVEVQKELGTTSNNSEPRTSHTVLRLRLVGPNPASPMSGLEELPGKVNYFIGKDPKKWRTNIPTYAKVKQPHVYPGIDLVYYGDQRQLEFDFIVAPGADPDAIKFNVEGANGVEVNRQGDLVLHLRSGELWLQKPAVYQTVNGGRQEVDGRFVLQGSHQVSFQVDAYDVNKPLIIDPTLFYSTYLGGSGSDGPGLNTLKVDAAGNAYLAGTTNSVDFPTTTGSLQATPVGSFDGFVTKLNPTGSGLVYSTYLGGTNNDSATGIALDALGNAYVTGFTSSTNFPTTLGAFQPAFAGGPRDGFVTKLDPSGSTLVYSTYLGGTVDEEANAITVDAAGDAYVTGATTSANFPATPGAFSMTFISGDAEIFVTKLDATGSALLYSTAIPGAHPQTDVGRAIVVDAAGNAYVSGVTRTGIGTPGAFQTGYQGGINGDGFVLKLNPTGSALVYATNLGGSGGDEANSLEIDAAGNAYVCGSTGSPNFPTTLGAFQTGFGGGINDSFVTKLNPTGSAPLVFSTFLGGNDEETGCVLAVDAAMGNIYTLSGTKSTNLSVTPDAFQSSLAGGFDAYIAKLNAMGSGLLFASYLGGTGNENTGGQGIALDSLGNAYYVAGNTSSTDFPTTAGSFQPAFNGVQDAYVAKISDVGAAFVLDHFKCYKVDQEDPKFEKRTVTLADQFGTAEAEVVKLMELCNPVSKNRERINHPDTHLKIYEINDTMTEEKRNVRVTNQFGSQNLQVEKAELLLVPAAKAHPGQNLGDPNPLLNHFKCYKVGTEDPKFVEREVHLKDQFAEERVVVHKPRFLCNPVKKNEEDMKPTQEPDHLVYYEAKGNIEKFTVITRDQFSPSQRLQLAKSETLLVPSTKERLEVE